MSKLDKHTTTPLTIRSLTSVLSDYYLLEHVRSPQSMCVGSLGFVFHSRYMYVVLA